MPSVTACSLMPGSPGRPRELRCPRPARTRRSSCRPRRPPAAASRSARSRCRGTASRPAGSNPTPSSRDVQQHHVVHVRQREPRPWPPSRAGRRWSAPPGRPGTARPRCPPARGRGCRRSSSSAGDPGLLDQPRSARPAPRPAARSPAARAAAPGPSGGPRPGSTGPATGPGPGAGTTPRAGALACSAASSWATIPARPCASVSWISPGQPLAAPRPPRPSRACSTSWACSAAFSAIASSSRRFASASSPIIRPRSTFCSSAR